MQSTVQILKEPKGLQPPLEGGRRDPNLCPPARRQEALSLRFGLMRKAAMGHLSEPMTGIQPIPLLSSLVLCFGSSSGWDFQLCLEFQERKHGLLLSEVSFSCLCIYIWEGMCMHDQVCLGADVHARLGM